MNDYLRAESKFLQAPDPDLRCCMCGTCWDLIEYNDEMWCPSCKIMDTTPEDEEE